MKVAYKSNNSGGSWWLKDKHWKALEDAGWYVHWGNDYFCGGSYSFNEPPKGAPRPCKDTKKCPGHRRFDSAEAVDAVKGGRWLGTLADDAEKDFPSLREAILEWEKVVGMEATEEGCNCCGPPHSFSSGEGKSWQYASGKDIVAILYGEESPRSLREAAERLKAKP